LVPGQLSPTHYARILDILFLGTSVLCPGNEFSYQGHRNSDVIEDSTR